MNNHSKWIKETSNCISNCLYHNFHVIFFIVLSGFLFDPLRIKFSSNTSLLISYANQLPGFYMRRTLITWVKIYQGKPIKISMQSFYKASFTKTKIEWSPWFYGYDCITYIYNNDEKKSSDVNNGRSSDKSDRFYIAVGHLKIEIQLMSDQILVQLKNIPHCCKNIKSLNEAWNYNTNRNNV